MKAITLDTYSADLLNESSPRREQVTELIDYDTGKLLCYANPEEASLIRDSLNRTAPLTEAEETRRGELIVKLLNLPEATHYDNDCFTPARYDTAGGTKTALGLYRTLARIVETGE